FRSSHEVMKIEEVSDEQIRAMIDEELVQAHRSRALTPDHPVMRGTAQNRDVFFQSRERANSFYDATPAIVEGVMKRFVELIGSRYGLGSKEFTPAMVKSVFDEMSKDSPKNHFSVGIVDDVTNNSLPFDPSFTTEKPGQVRALFWGLGADGTISANKNSIKI